MMAIRQKLLLKTNVQKKWKFWRISKVAVFVNISKLQKVDHQNSGDHVLDCFRTEAISLHNIGIYVIFM